MTFDDVFVHETAVVSEEANIGPGTQIWVNTQVREKADIGEECVLSKDVYVDRNVVMGDGCKIQNGVSVYEGITMEDKVFCGPHMTFTNDLNIRINPEEYEPISTHVKNWASIGAHATVLPDLTIGEYAMVGAHTLVTGDVPDHALVYGVPGELRGVVCYCGRKIRNIEELDDVQPSYRCSDCDETVSINPNRFEALITND